MVISIFNNMYSCQPYLHLNKSKFMLIFYFISFHIPTFSLLTQQSQQPPQTREQLKKTTYELAIQVVLWDSHTYAAGLNQLYVFFSLLYCSISNKWHVQTRLLLSSAFIIFFYISQFLSETTKIWCEVHWFFGGMRVA
jgi:membrane-associated HD superfamily phosphohydrolase